MNYCCLSVYDFVWHSMSHLTLACTDVGRLKKYQWSNKCKYVSISSVNFHGKFALKFEMRYFMNHYIPLEPTVKLSLDAILANVYSFLL